MLNRNGGAPDAKNSLLAGKAISRVRRRPRCCAGARAAEVEHLKLFIAKLRRMQFGRKSEKLDGQIEQLELRLEELEADEGEAPVEIPKTPRTAAEQTPRRPLPEHLPREIRTHLPEAAGKCLECGGEMKPLGEDVAEQLEYVPASFRVIRHVRPKFACARCDHISTGARHRVVPLSAASPARGCWRTCWSRSSQITCRFTGSQSCTRQKASSWIARCLRSGSVTLRRLLQPLVETLRRHVMSATKLHADDTPVPGLAPGNGRRRPVAYGCTCAMIVHRPT